MKPDSGNTGREGVARRWLVPLAFLLVMVASWFLNVPFSHQDASRPILLVLITLGMLSTMMTR